MRLGALLTPAGDQPNHLVNEARAIESAGFDSIWSAHATGRGFVMHDPLLALTAAAAVTTRVELGTGILQLPLYHPADVVLKVLTLLQIAGDRLLLGVGAGSTQADYALHDQVFSRRFHQMEISLKALRQGFASGQVGNGDVELPPNLKGGPPLLLGTWGQNVKRAATEFDGWIASGLHRTPVECGEALKAYQAAGGQRAIVSTILVMGNTDIGALREQLTSYAEAGFDDAVLMVYPGAPSLEALRALV